MACDIMKRDVDKRHNGTKTFRSLFFFVWVQTKFYPLQWNLFCNFSFLFFLEYYFFLSFLSILNSFYFFYGSFSILPVLMLAHSE